MDGAILILRFTIGGVMIPHGVYKFRKRHALDKKWREEYGLPIGSVLLTSVIQIVGGLAVMVGVYGRYAASVLALNMLVATYISIWKNREPFLSTPAGKGWDINLLLIGVMVALIFFDGGN